MALPTTTDLYDMEFTFQGVPFVDAPAKAAIDLTEMEHTFQGAPFVVNAQASAATSNIKAVNGVTYANIKAINGVAKASIKKLNSVQ